jgi:hypothetical protein
MRVDFGGFFRWEESLAEGVVILKSFLLQINESAKCRWHPDPDDEYSIRRAYLYVNAYCSTTSIHKDFFEMK